MMNEYTKQAQDFLQKANATISIDLVGLAINKEWKETAPRNLYNVTLTSPKGSMTFDFWDSLHNTEISRMTLDEYTAKRYRCKADALRYSERVTASRELKQKKEEARPTVYDVLACMTKYDPGTFEDFCNEFGYDEDSRTAERIYFAVQKEYSQLSRLFSADQMEELAEIQ